MTDLTKFLTEAREVGAKATDGPWFTKRTSSLVQIVCQTTYQLGGGEIKHEEVLAPKPLPIKEEYKPNAEFIAFARNHWDEMLDLLERQAKALEVARDILELFTNEAFYNRRGELIGATGMGDTGGHFVTQPSAADKYGVKRATQAILAIKTILAGKGEG